jgi:hypothetical protein
MSAKQQKQQKQQQQDNSLQQLSKDEVIEQLGDTGIDEPTQNSIADLLSEDYVFANIKTTDREYARLLAKNIVHLSKCRHPPEDSHVSGAARAVLRGDIDDEIEPMDKCDKNQIESLLLGMFFRTSRSVGGWQQDKLSEQIQTRRVEDNRGAESDGPLGGIFS